MTVSTEVSREEYTGNGVTTDFDYRFRVFSAEDLVVSVADTTETITVLTLNTDYTVTGAGSRTGGKVKLLSPLAFNWRISIERALPVTQETDIRNQGNFFPEVHEDAFDKLTMLIQQVWSYFGLALRKPSWLAKYYDALGNRIANLGNPVNNQDATTKIYVDAGDASSHEYADDLFNRTLRVPEISVQQLPTAATRRNKILAFDNIGEPMTVLPESGSATDVLIELAKPTGSGLIGTFPIGTLADLLTDVAPTMWKHLKVVTINGDDWSAAINTCIQYAVDNHKRVVLPQEFSVGNSVILQSRTTMHGFGVSVSKITALPGFSGDIVKSKDAPEIDYLTDLSPGSEVYSLSLRDFSIVGGWDSDASTGQYINQRDGLRIFGVQHSLDNITIMNVRGKGFNIGGRSNTSIPGMAPSDYNRLRADHCGAEGFIFGGTSDSHASQIKVRDAGQLANATYIAIRIGQNGTLRASQVHVWNSSTALRHECCIEILAYDTILHGAHFEGAQNCQVRLTGGRNQLSGIEVYNQWSSGGAMIEVLNNSNSIKGRAYVSASILPGISVYAVKLGNAANQIAFTNVDIEFYNTKLGVFKIDNHSGYLSGKAVGDTLNYTSTQNRALVVSGSLIEGKDSVIFDTPQYRSFIGGGSINVPLNITAQGDVNSSNGLIYGNSAVFRNLPTAPPATTGAIYVDPANGNLKAKL